MVVFGLGTAPALLAAAWGLRRLTAQHLWARRALAVAVLAAGWWSIGTRSGWLASEAHASHQGDAMADEVPSCH